MRAYFKTTTQRPICVYLSKEEAAEILEEFADVLINFGGDNLPLLGTMRDLIKKVST